METTTLADALAAINSLAEAKTQPNTGAGSDANLSKTINLFDSQGNVTKMSLTTVLGYMTGVATGTSEQSSNNVDANDFEPNTLYGLQSTVTDETRTNKHYPGSYASNSSKSIVVFTAGFPSTKKYRLQIACSRDGEVYFRACWYDVWGNWVKLAITT